MPVAIHEKRIICDNVNCAIFISRHVLSGKIHIITLHTFSRWFISAKDSTTMRAVPTVIESFFIIVPVLSSQVRESLKTPYNYGNNMNGRKERMRTSAIVYCDLSPVFYPAGHVFDFVAFFTECFVVFNAWFCGFSPTGCMAQCPCHGKHRSNALHLCICQ